MKDSHDLIEDQLSFFDLHKSRLKCLVQLLLGFLTVRSVNLCKLSLCFDVEVKSNSVYRRIQRFLSGVIFPFDQLSCFVWDKFQDTGPTVLALDRTNWKFGKANINILMLSICRDGFAVPLMWKVLKNKRGNSSQEERIELMQRFVSVIQTDQIVRLVADREFIGEKWLNWLDENYFHFIIRIRANQWVEHSPRKSQRAAAICSSEQWTGLRKARFVKGAKVYLGGQKLKTGDFLILISNLPLKSARYYYAKRWAIEVLFGNLKKRGFNFEDTHITHPHRINNLIAVLALAQVWAILVGQWIAQKVENIPIKKHGRKAMSIFKIGLDCLANKIFRNNDLQMQINLLSCT
ncbi:MAG: IS4 family transposase [Bacteroidota bacterium]